MRDLADGKQGSCDGRSSWSLSRAVAHPLLALPFFRRGARAAGDLAHRREWRSGTGGARCLHCARPDRCHRCVQHNRRPPSRSPMTTSRAPTSPFKTSIPPVCRQRSTTIACTLDVFKGNAELHCRARRSDDRPCGAVACRSRRREQLALSWPRQHADGSPRCKRKTAWSPRSSSSSADNSVLVAGLVLDGGTRARCTRCRRLTTLRCSRCRCAGDRLLPTYCRATGADHPDAATATTDARAITFTTAGQSVRVHRHQRGGAMSWTVTVTVTQHTQILNLIGVNAPARDGNGFRHRGAGGTMTRIRRVLTGLGGACRARALRGRRAVGALAPSCGWPLPHTTPSLSGIGHDHSQRGLPAKGLVDALAVVVWVVWAILAVSVIAETVATARGSRASLAAARWALPTAITGRLVAAVHSVAVLARHHKRKLRRFLDPQLRAWRRLQAAPLQRSS